VLDQELEIGLRSIAVPVRSAVDARLIAAINVATNASTVSKKRLMGEFLPILRRAAESISGSIIKPMSAH
jgi:IclR family pca regulon transcriptional regulator